MAYKLFPDSGSNQNTSKSDTKLTISQKVSFYIFREASCLVRQSLIHTMIYIYIYIYIYSYTKTNISGWDADVQILCLLYIFIVTSSCDTLQCCQDVSVFLSPTVYVYICNPQAALISLTHPYNDFDGLSLQVKNRGQKTRLESVFNLYFVFSKYCRIQYKIKLIQKSDQKSKKGLKDIIVG